MNDFLMKFLIIGDQGVGKSSLISNYYQQVAQTVGVDFVTKNIVSGERNIKLHIWDASGNLCFLNILRSYFRTCIGIILVFDLGRVETFNNIDFWIQQISMENNRYRKMILIGTHCEKVREVSDEMIREKCRIYGIEYFERNLNFSIDLCLLKLSSSIIRDRQRNPGIMNNLEGFRGGHQITNTSDYIRFEDGLEENGKGEDKCDLCCQNNCSIL